MSTNAPSPTSPTAIVSLIFGVVTWFALPFLGAIIAIICGHVARGEIRRAPPGTIGGDGLALGGLILGYLHLLVFVLAAIAFLGFFGGLAWLSSHH